MRAEWGLALLLLAAHVAAQSLPSVVDVLNALPVLTTFRDSLRETELLQALEGAGPFTVFAPSNTAIDLLGPGVLETLRYGQNSQYFLELLQYHVVYANVGSSDMSPGLTLMTWSSKTLEITDVAPSIRLNGVAPVTQADVACSNGMVHVLSRVARPPAFSFPPPLKNILELTQSSSYLTNFGTGLELSGLAEEFSDPRTERALTVLLPTDAAFANLGLGIASSLQLPANLDHLLRLLKYHAVRGVHASADLAPGEKLQTLEGSDVTITSVTPGMLVNEATVISRDVPATNGMVQLMDQVLLPTTWSYPDKTITQIVQTSPNLSILQTALRLTDMEWIFASATKQTLLAPTDEAFRALGPGVASSLLLMSNLEDLVALLRLHMIESVHKSDEMVLRSSIVTKQGEAVVIDALSPLSINGARSAVQDVPATNGILHIMDSVVMPKLWRFPERNLMQFANKESELSDFVGLVMAAGLLEEFQGTGPFTALIPNNYAFYELGALLDDLRAPSSAQNLKEVLRYHIVKGKHLSMDLTSPQDLVTLQGASVQAVPWTNLGWNGIAYDSASPPVVINSIAQVTKPDVSATNGIVHVIDRVLFPPGLDQVYTTTQAKIPIISSGATRSALTLGLMGLTVKVHLLSPDVSQRLLRGSAETVRALKALHAATSEAEGHSEEHPEHQAYVAPSPAAAELPAASGDSPAASRTPLLAPDAPVLAPASTATKAHRGPKGPTGDVGSAGPPGPPGPPGPTIVVGYQGFGYNPYMMNPYVMSNGMPNAMPNMPMANMPMANMPTVPTPGMAANATASGFGMGSVPAVPPVALAASHAGAKEAQVARAGLLESLRASVRKGASHFCSEEPP
ncbi:unnamed protein product [Effrenium voratum]|nr:unnamed protein product [Effrenium voratum]